jgi:paraquat-inducible protein B
MATAEATVSRDRIRSRVPPAAVAKATAVGAFVLGGLMICVVAILLFGGSHLFATKLRVVVFFQDSVAGLTVGAPVTLRGVQVGTVQSMKVYIKLPELVPIIPVYLDIEPRRVSWSHGSPQASAADLEAAIKAGLRAQLATQSLVTGQVSVNLDFHPEKPATMVGGDSSVPEIPSTPSDFQHIKNEIADLNLADLTDKARTALVDVDEIVLELRGRVGPLADDIKQTSEAARVTLETATEAVKQLQGQANQTLASVDRLAATTQGQVQTTGQELDRTLAEVRQTADQANKVLGSLNDMTAARSPVRGDFETTLRDLAAAASSLRDFTRELERHPNELLVGRSSK